MTMSALAGVLGEVKVFRKMYQNPILHGREPDASEKVSGLHVPYHSPSNMSAIFCWPLSLHTQMAKC